MIQRLPVEEEYNKPACNLRKPVRDRQTGPRRVKNPGEPHGFDEGGGRLGASGVNPVFANITEIRHYNVGGNQSFGIYDLKLGDGNNAVSVELKSYTRTFVEEGIPGPNGALPFVQNPQIINQLRNYLTISSTANLTNLRYSFDARKLVKGLDGQGTMQTNPFNTISEAENWIKIHFQETMQNQSNQVFESIWNNLPLRSNLWPDIDDIIVARSFFNTWTEDLGSILFSFIRVE